MAAASVAAAWVVAGSVAAAWVAAASVAAASVAAASVAAAWVAAGWVAAASVAVASVAVASVAVAWVAVACSVAAGCSEADSWVAAGCSVGAGSGAAGGASLPPQATSATARMAAAEKATQRMPLSWRKRQACASAPEKDGARGFPSGKRRAAAQWPGERRTAGPDHDLGGRRLRGRVPAPEHPGVGGAPMAPRY